MGKMKEKYMRENFPEWDEIEYKRDNQIAMEYEWEQFEKWKQEKNENKSKSILTTKIEIGDVRYKQKPPNNKEERGDYKTTQESGTRL
jgi:hypothetical protein